MVEAAPKLAGLMAHPDADIRLALVETAESLREGTTTEALIGALSDAERDVRLAAARALAALGYELAAPALKELVTSKEIRQADLTEKITIFESYGVLGGADAADVLNTLLNKKSFSANVGPRRSERRRHGPWVRLGFPVARRLSALLRGMWMPLSAPRCGRPFRELSSEPSREWSREWSRECSRESKRESRRESRR